MGHVVSARGVATNKSKINEVENWVSPTNVKQLRQFLGLAGYYRKFVQHFGIIAKPLTNLLKKNVPFQWTSTAEQAFQLLKQKLVTASVLALPSFSVPFVIDTDAADSGVGAVLHQQGHPIAFMSKSLGPKMLGLSTYDKEFLAIIMAVDHWRSYLQHAEFIIQTDHHSLTHLEEQRLHTPWQKKAFTKLLGLQYKICYKKGIENGAADALSRKVHVQPDQLSVISICQPAWLDEVVQGYANDATASKLLTELAASSEKAKGSYTLDNGVSSLWGEFGWGSTSSCRTRLFQHFMTVLLGAIPASL